MGRGGGSSPSPVVLVGVRIIRITSIGLILSGLSHHRLGLSFAPARHTYVVFVACLAKLLMKLSPSSFILLWQR